MRRRRSLPDLVQTGSEADPPIGKSQVGALIAPETSFGSSVVIPDKTKRR